MMMRRKKNVSVSARNFYNRFLLLFAFFVAEAKKKESANERPGA
jgi:hypothetical protein